jgi:hypothetical protein
VIPTDHTILGDRDDGVGEASTPGAVGLLVQSHYIACLPVAKDRG